MCGHCGDKKRVHMYGEYSEPKTHAREKALKKKVHPALIGKSRGAELARAQELAGKGPSNPEFAHYFDGSDGSVKNRPATGK